jgi:hypothetical protein
VAALALDARTGGEAMNESNEALLQQVVLGQLAEDAPEVRTLAARDAEFARELEATMAVVHALKKGEQLREAVLVDVARRAPAGDRPPIVPAQPSRRRSLALWLPLAAAAAIVLGILWWNSRDGGAHPDDLPLGDPEKIECVGPKDEVDVFEVFEWRTESLAGWFRVTVHNRASGEEIGYDVYGARTWDSRGRLDPAWRDIDWTVERFNSSNVPQPGGDSAHASLRP